MSSRQEVADWIEKGLGLEGVSETGSLYIHWFEQSQMCYACALGLALVGKVGNVREASEMFSEAYAASKLSPRHLVANLLDISVELAEEIDHRHHRPGDAAEIARWLREEGGGGEG